MRLTVELDDAEYERLLRSEVPMICAPLREVTVAQRDGLLRQEFRAGYAEVLGYAVAHQLGLPDGMPNIRVWLKAGEENP